MHIKNLTLGLGLVLAGTALAQPQTYKVKNGDCDWTIARKFDTTIHKLHLANPDVQNWDALRNGYALRIPSASAPKIAAHSNHHSIVATHHSASRPFKVSGDDNDWIIAHHLGISLHLLHQLNPDVDWNRLRPGKKILVPGEDSSEGTVVAKASSKTGSKTKINRIRSHYAVVNTNGVSIRREAGQHAERITTVDTGTKVVVLDRDGAWYKLRFPRGTEGWVRGDFLNASRGSASSERRHHRSSNEDVVVRRRTRHHGGSGHESVVFLDNDTKADPIIKRAVAMRGTRYGYGSNSRSLTDCSGYTWQVFKSQGIHLPRTSSEQSQVGQVVKSNQLKPGDLVFFSSRGHRHGVGHVGIYVGKDKFIHASSGGGKVQFNSLHDPYYESHFKGARRVVKSGSHKSSSTSHKVAHVEHHESASSDTNPTPLGK